MSYGYYKRPTRRVNVLRGFDGSDPSTFTRHAAVTAGVTIRSGDVVSLTAGKWVLGAATGKVPYIALSDGKVDANGVYEFDGSDPDVISAGTLPALSCAGKFEIETQSYIQTAALAEGTPLISVKAANTPVGAVVGQLTDGALNGTSDIIGFASRGGVTNLNAGVGPQIEVNAVSGNVLTFITNWSPLNQE